MYAIVSRYYSGSMTHGCFGQGHTCYCHPNSNDQFRDGLTAQNQYSCMFKTYSLRPYQSDVNNSLRLLVVGAMC